jgi:hypothetical protein
VAGARDLAADQQVDARELVAQVVELGAPYGSSRRWSSDEP